MIEDAWERCRPWIVAALAESPGLETIEDVEAMLKSGRYQLWASMDGAIVTRVDEFARAKALMAVHGGGKLSALMDLLIPEIEIFARESGFDYFGGEGRAGWVRALKPKGYEVAFITMLKPLKEKT